ncbi:MAG: hypothetical protein HC883_04015 [Bdellovibrionaceae bacterium]|nr:hypothetical protein [Pseudobdellovibrionaceae bacterium]
MDLHLGVTDVFLVPPIIKSRICCVTGGGDASVGSIFAAAGSVAGVAVGGGIGVGPGFRSGGTGEGTGSLAVDTVTSEVAVAVALLRGGKTGVGIMVPGFSPTSSSLVRDSGARIL